MLSTCPMDRTTFSMLGFTSYDVLLLTRLPLGEMAVTVETPEERLDLSNDDKTEHWWDKLTSQQQQALVSAVQDEFGGQD